MARKNKVYVPVRSNIVEWLSNDYNDTDNKCEICNGAASLTLEGYNEKTGRGYTVYVCSSLDCQEKCSKIVYDIVRTTP